MFYKTRYYREIDSKKLNLAEKILSMVVQRIDRHTSCTDISDLIQRIAARENRNPYDLSLQIKAAIVKLEAEGWIIWERVARLNNVHLVDRSLQQHPIIAVRRYRNQDTD